MVTHSPTRRNGGKMTLDQLIAQVRVERAKAAGYLQSLDSAISALTKATVVPPAATTGTGRVWTPEQKMKLSAALKKRWAAKKKQTKRTKSWRFENRGD